MTKPYTVAAVIQARMGSSRLPGKVLRPVGGRPALGWVVRAAEASKSVDEVVVATSTAPEDDEVVKVCAELGVAVVRGPEDDVLSRFLVALDAHPADAVVRLTSDCPLLDPAVIAQTVGAFRAASGHMDYLSTTLVRSLPRGLDVEVASSAALRKVDKHAQGYDRVHVTSALYNNPHRYRIAGLTFVPHADDLRITLDTEADGALLDALVEETGDKPPAWRVLVAMLRTRPDLVELNESVQQKALHEG